MHLQWQNHSQAFWGSFDKRRFGHEKRPLKNGRSYEHAPAALVVASLNVAFLLQTGEQTLHRRLVDAELLAQAVDGDGRLGLHNAKYLGIVRSSEFDPLAVVPPDILVRLRQEADVIVDLLCDQCGEVAEKRADLVQIGMSTGDQNVGNLIKVTVLL